MNTEELFVDGPNLPQPLSKEETFKLIEAINSGSKVAREKLIIHNIRLVIYEVINKFRSVNYDKKELVSIGNMGLLKAVKSYVPTRGVEFSSYAIKCIDNEILMFLRKMRREQKVDSFDSAIFYDKYGSEFKLEDKLSDESDLVNDYEEHEQNKIIRSVISQLPEKKKNILMLYFGFYNEQKYTQKEIADRLHITQSEVSKLLKRILKNVGSQLETQGIIEFSNNRYEKVYGEVRKLRK